MVTADDHVGVKLALSAQIHRQVSVRDPWIHSKGSNREPEVHFSSEEDRSRDREVTKPCPRAWGSASRNNPILATRRKLNI
jgi:hypothetical protein